MHIHKRRNLCILPSLPYTSSRFSLCKFIVASCSHVLFPFFVNCCYYSVCDACLNHFVYPECVTTYFCVLPLFPSQMSQVAVFMLLVGRVMSGEVWSLLPRLPRAGRSTRKRCPGWQNWSRRKNGWAYPSHHDDVFVICLYLWLAYIQVDKFVDTVITVSFPLVK